jgi:hypothetical protein
MFWDSVVGGLKVLTFWETYAAGLEYLLLFMGPMVLIGQAMGKSGEKSGAVGCLGMLVVPLLQVAAIAVFVLTLAPIIFGLGEDAAWLFPWKVIGAAPGVFVKLVGVLVISAIALAFVPFLGQLQSLHTLVLGGIALVFVLGVLRSVNPELASSEVDVIPGFWFTAGLLIIGALMAWLGIMVVALLTTAVGGGAVEDAGELLMVPVAAIFGFIPVFMYGSWLGSQLRHGF